MNEHLGDKLIDYVWDTLTPYERAQAEDHLRDCAGCRAELARHQSLVNQVAAAVPAMLPATPSHVRNGWPEVAARLPGFGATTSSHHGWPGLIAIGLALSTAMLIIAVIVTQAWLGLNHPPLMATVPHPSATPIASATYTPEYPTAVATSPMYWGGNGWVASPMQVIRAERAERAQPQPIPVMTTVKP